MTLLLGVALASEPAGVVRAAVVIIGTEVDEVILATTRNDTERVLEASGRYQILDQVYVEGRLGVDPDSLQCDEPSCWSEAGVAVGADQLVVLHLRADWVGPRTDVMVVDVNSQNVRVAPSMHLPAAGGAPIESLEHLLLGDGDLKMSWNIDGATLMLNGEPVPSVGGHSTTLPAGKHLVRLQAEGYAPVFAAVLIVPGEDTHVVLHQNPIVEPYVRRNWGPWAAAALVGAGGAALAATASVAGVAWTP